MKRLHLWVICSVVSIFTIYLFTVIIFDSLLCPWRGVETADKFPDPSFFAAYEKAQAIPVFARKYGTSCQTCHIAFPSLTPFGVAFKKNGMRWPGEGSDPEFDPKEAALPLGAEIQKKGFPNTVWPGTIPGGVPISVKGLFQFVSRPNDDTANAKAQFNTFASQFGILSAGTLGRRFFLWGGVNFNLSTDVNTGDIETEVELERIYGIYRPFNKPIFMMRFGSYEPTLGSVSVHRSLLGGYYFLTDKTVGDNGFTPEGTQQGIEFSGIAPGGRFAYAIGVVEGNGNKLNNQKDLYGRLEYKLGGLRFDGVADKHYKSTKPWRDDSTTFGVFSYLGFANVTNSSIIDPPTQEQDDRFYLVGADLYLNYFNFLINTGYVFRQDNHPLLAMPTMGLNTHNFFFELNWVAYPWFIPGVKYELFDSGPVLDQRITIGTTFLIRANIKAFLRGTLERLTDSSFTENPEIRAGMFLVF